MNFSRELLYYRHRLSHRQIEELTGEQQTNTAFDEKIKQLKSVSEFLEITASLQKAGIWFVPLKGPLLSYRIYGDATCRIAKDIDILVKPEDLHKTFELLELLNYQSGSFKWPGPGYRQNRVLLFLNQYSMYHPERSTPVEIHWRLFKNPVISNKKLTAFIDEDVNQIEFAGQKFNQFSPEFELLHLIIHGGLHAWTRLKWLVDVKEIINRLHVDKEKFGHLIKLFRAQRMAGLCNAMLLHFFPGTTLLPVNDKVPGWFFRFSLLMASRETVVHMRPPEIYYKFIWFTMQAFPGFRYKTKRISVFLITLLQQLKHKSKSLNMSYYQ